jgi:hypothetical protein
MDFWVSINSRFSASFREIGVNELFGRNFFSEDLAAWHQGCQMVCFQTKNPNLGKFWRVLQWKISVNFMDIWYILWSFVIFYEHLV